MGRPYQEELLAIEQTYTMAAQTDISKLENFIWSHGDANVIAMGSGGAYAVANTFALMMQTWGRFAKSITPFELYMEREVLQDAIVVIFSASGSNQDIVNAYEYIKSYGPQGIFLVCMSTQSRLVKAMKQDNCYDFLEFVVPNGKDGFLAVNSTIGFLSILEALAHTMVPTTQEAVPLSFQFRDCPKPLEYHNLTLITLGGNWTMPVAIDFESKCSEVGLCNVQLTNYRNFAHGRHQWIATHPQHTAMVCFASKQEEEILNSTLALIPDNIPKLIFRTEQTGLRATIELMIQMFHFTAHIGQVVGIDPGQPKVSTWGRSIYRIDFPLEKLELT